MLNNLTDRAALALKKGDMRLATREILLKTVKDVAQSKDTLEALDKLELFNSRMQEIIATIKSQANASA
jgi:hypothetical protein